MAKTATLPKKPPNEASHIIDLTGDETVDLTGDTDLESSSDEGPETPRPAEIASGTDSESSSDEEDQDTSGDFRAVIIPNGKRKATRTTSEPGPKRPATHTKVDAKEKIPELKQTKLSSFFVRKVQCLACYEDLIPSAFATKITAECNHASRICAECVQGSLSAQLSDTNTRITCPNADCHLQLTHEDIRTHGTYETFVRYDTAISREAIRAMPGFTPCPSAKCPGGHFHETPEAGNIFTCEVCKTKYCVVCNVPFHTGQTCREYVEVLNTAPQRREEEEKSKAYIERSTKKCPGENCGWNIEKSEGCDHMTCRRCGHEFCWVCFAPWAPIVARGGSNALHNPHCKYYATHDPENDDSETYDSELDDLHDRMHQDFSDEYNSEDELPAIGESSRTQEDEAATEAPPPAMQPHHTRVIRGNDEANVASPPQVQPIHMQLHRELELTNTPPGSPPLHVRTLREESRVRVQA